MLIWTWAHISFQCLDLLFGLGILKIGQLILMGTLVNDPKRIESTITLALEEQIQ